MELTVGKTNENPYLGRKEVYGKVSFQGATPSQKQLADALAQKLGVKADAIFIVHVFTNFGAQAAVFEAHVYSSKDQLNKVVKLGTKAKEKAAKAAAATAAPAAAEAPKAEAKPAEAAKAEAPKKEEKKAEA
jgi:ribosomal protein S24E